MNERQRIPDGLPGSGSPGSPSPLDSSQTPELRRQADDFLAQGDAIIQAALSSDSEAFLRATQQLGGQ
jgi:hypothetical protein